MTQTYVVWMLILFQPGSERAPVVVDNIATKQDCLALRAAAVARYPLFGHATCYSVRKAKP